jgi:lipoyl(octanoyl) transferase
MDARVAAIRAGTASEAVWLLEHPPLYTAGTSADPAELVSPDRFDVFQTGRGGRYTYHGPGQRIAYVMLDLRQRGADVRAYVHNLERWVISSLAEFGIAGACHDDRIGIWVERPAPDAAPHMPIREEKIAAIGVRIRHWVTFHGISININPDLEHFSGIIPCGIEDFGVTSLHAMGIEPSPGEFDNALKRTFDKVFPPLGGIR